MKLPCPLEKLEPKRAREAFGHDELALNKWLARKDVLEALGDAIGTKLRLVSVNRSVSPSLRPDVIAESRDYGKVVIESQLGAADWDHLGRLLGYASALDAGCMVWLVADAPESHAKTASWLNSVAFEEKGGIFVVRLALWGDASGSFGSCFETVVRPGGEQAGARPRTPLERCQHSYWARLEQESKEDAEFSSLMKVRKAPYAYNMDISIGSKEYCIRLEAVASEREVRAGFYSYRDKSLTDLLEENLDEIERALGTKGAVFRKTASGVKFTKTECDVFGDKERWGEFIAWQLDAAVKINKWVNGTLRRPSGR